MIVKTPARLHLGVIDLSGAHRRLFGSIGVAIDRPNVVLEVEKSDRLEVVGQQKNKIILLIKTFSKKFKIKGNVRVNVRETIPEHVGLGSGTQLALAIGFSLSKFFHLNLSLKAIAEAMGRGSVSGIGLGAFEHGGFLVDAGKKVNTNEIPPIIFRHNFPEEWAFVVVIPKVKKGFSGNKEKDAFKKVIPGNPKTASEINCLLNLKLIPSLKAGNIKNFGSALSQIDKKVGEYFSEVQGGTYANPKSEKIIKFMLKNGAHGAGQSSWGPAVYGLIEKKNAGKLEKLVSKKFRAVVFATSANNKGAVFSG